MKLTAVVCPNCQQSLPGAYSNTSAPITCPACTKRVWVAVFPAFFRTTAAGAAAESILEEGVSSCFYHEQRKAVVACAACGRFLCALCDLEFDGQHHCPACLNAGRKKGRMPTLETSRTLHDSTALLLALLPLTVVLAPFAIITAPVAVYFAILSWKRPNSLVPRGRWRSHLALILGVLGVIGWIVGLVLILQNQ